MMACTLGHRARRVRREGSERDLGKHRAANVLLERDRDRWSVIATQPNLDVVVSRVGPRLGSDGGTSYTCRGGERRHRGDDDGASEER